VGNGETNQGTLGASGLYTGRPMRCALDLTAGSTFSGGLHPNYSLIEALVHQTAFSGALLLPLHCFVLTDPGARYAPLGYPASMFYCTAVGHGFSGGDVYQVGGLDYMLFPYFAVRKAA
jgi:hypothetical protein